MAKSRGLGKGLQALIPQAGAAAAERERLREIDVAEIRPAPRQSRQLFDREKLAELAASIKQHGVIQPVLVRPLEDGGYELIAGERRWRACRELGLAKIPAMVKECRDLEATAVSLIENVQREDLNPLEEATAYHQLMEDFDLTQEEVSSRVGKSRPFVANMVRLLGLPAKVKEMLAAGRLQAGHARALLGLPDERKQVALALRIARQQLSVRQAEAMVKALNEKKAKKEKGRQAELTRYMLQAQENLSALFGSGARVRKTAEGGGRLEIPFGSDRELKKIMAIILGDGQV